jgi:CRISPR-associated endonuclease/helicase Cas3
LQESQSAHAEISRYWGKAKPLAGGGLPTHPLAYHSLDVAGAMAALLDAWPWALARLAAATGLQSGQARGWALAAAALHDLGKFADAFQAKAPDHWSGRPAWPGGLQTQGFDHGSFGRELWTASSARGRFEFDAHRQFHAWLMAAWGHHGAPPDAKRPYRNRHCDVIRGAATGDAHAFADAICDLFQVATNAPDIEPGPETWLFAGLCIIADWIGSNQAWFPYRAADLAIADYWREVAVPKGAVAVRAAGLTAASPATTLTLAQLTGRDDAPTPLQRWAAEVALPDGPMIAIVEDLTGAGKTEAALLLAHRLIAAGRASGLYWALPTQATANMLHDRFKPAGARAGYRAIFDRGAAPSLALAHGGVDLAEGFQSTIIRPADPASAAAQDGEAYGDAADAAASAQCAAWLADERRKSLLAHVGVGTIDQALMAALPRRFAALRQAALAGRVLIVDEVHGYDPFVARTLKGLLAVHAAHGGSAILLSATLTTVAKSELVAGFAEGLGRIAPPLQQRSFPLATIVDGAAAHAAPIASQRGTRRDLSVRRIDDPAAALAHVVDHARAGRCAVWIRNTVGDALDAYDALLGAGPDVRATLFHSRFMIVDRAAIEAEVLAAFGPASREVDRTGRVLIATQVVEQSLDLDFDAMVSDLAPLELLIQRAGRLHRHDRGARPPPELLVLGPNPALAADAAWYARAFPRAARVYGDHAKLWAGLNLLVHHGALPLSSRDPRSLLETIDRVVEADGVPEPLRRSHEETWARDSAGRATARSQLVAQVRHAFHEDGRSWGRDDEAPTRLGAEQRLLRLAQWREEVLTPLAGGTGWAAWRRSEVQWWASAIAAVGAGTWDHAVAAARADWPGWLDGCLLVPMAGTDAAGFTAPIADASGTARCLFYSHSRGLILC